MPNFQPAVAYSPTFNESIQRNVHLQASATQSPASIVSNADRDSWSPLQSTLRFGHDETKQPAETNKKPKPKNLLEAIIRPFMAIGNWVKQFFTHLFSDLNLLKDTVNGLMHMHEHRKDDHTAHSHDDHAEKKTDTTHKHDGDDHKHTGDTHKHAHDHKHDGDDHKHTGDTHKHAHDHKHDDGHVHGPNCNH